MSGFTYAAPTDKVIDSVATTLASKRPDLQNEIKSAKKCLRKIRPLLANLANDTSPIEEGSERTSGEGMVIMYCAIQAACIIQSKGQVGDHPEANLTDHDLTLIVNCIEAGGAPPFASPEVVDCSIIGCFLLDPMRLAKIIAGKGAEA